MRYERVLVSSLLLALFFSGTVPAEGVERTVLAEMFTNWACPPCRPAGEEIDRFLPLHPGLVVVRYHTWWPLEDDPFYVSNAAENRARTEYYGIMAVPRFYVDGIVNGGPDYLSWEGLVSARESIESPVDMSLDGSYDWETRTGMLHLSAVATDTIHSTSLRLRTSIIESGIETHAPNGETLYNQVMRDMLPDAGGEPVYIWLPGDTLSRETAFSLDGAWEFENCEVVAFIQSDLDTEVLQAVKWKVPVLIPGLEYVKNSILDSLGNRDGRADPGEAVEMVVTLSNGSAFKDAANVKGAITCDNPDVNITHGTADFADIPAGLTGDNSSDPFKFSLDPSSEPGYAYFTMTMTADPGGYHGVERFWILVGRPPILLVDDDAGAAYEAFFETSLVSLGLPYDKWDVKADSAGPELTSYHCVIWFTGDDSVSALTGQEQGRIAPFLDGGGNLLITGQNIGEGIAGEPFLADYLHSLFVASPTQDHVINGVPGDPVGDGISLVSAGGGGADNQSSQDVITPLGGASAAFRYSPDSVACVRYDSGNYRVIYFGFGLEGLAAGIPGYSDRDTVLLRSLAWLGCPGSVGIELRGHEPPESSSRVTLDCLPNPFSKSTSILVGSADGPCDGAVRDVSGRLVRRLTFRAGADCPGLLHAEWDGTDSSGRALTSGLYFVTASTAGTSTTEKVVLLR